MENPLEKPETTVHILCCL